ncbi:MAG: hypothetical protein FIB01_00730, partial [Gemmatimonadetes bacterium]|nr:hypothetical protein [Gemmatimonadota bacterium]
MSTILRSAGRAGRLIPFLLVAACAAESVSEPGMAAYARAGADPGTHLQYGAPVALGAGRARAYGLRDEVAGVPLELGVALDATALQGLGEAPRALELPLPPRAPEPYRFVLLDWNPEGHEPPGIYTFPHFDFHFYQVPASEVRAIDPAGADFAAQANDVPTGGYVPPFYVVLGPPGAPPAAVAVPRMGVHWSDVRSPELQGMLGNPAGYQQFTKTFIYGSWAGKFTFLEPMITRAYLQSADDVTPPISTPA